MTEESKRDLIMTLLEYKEIGNEAVLAVQQENRERGIPNVFSRNSRVYFEMPNGEITTKDPFS